MTATAVLSAAEPARAAEWWEVAGGIIAIPVALIGLVLTWVLIRKTNLESRKAELEIRAMEGALETRIESAASPAELASAVAAPIIEAQKTQAVLLKTVLLAIMYVGWRFVDDVVGATAVGFAGLAELTGLDVLWYVVYLTLKVAVSGTYAFLMARFGLTVLAEAIALLGWRLPRVLRFQSRNALNALAIGCAFLLVLNQLPFLYS